MKPRLSLSLFTLTTLFVGTQTAIAQTIPTASPYTPSNRVPVSDNTLGTQVSGAGSNFDITGGVSKGQTLFHSFTDFSVPTSGQANFLNPVGNRDIITRVTGNLFSDINGLVNTNGANFFLINPSGIVFGPNAQLNAGKAFVGSTANSIDIVGGGQTITFGTNPSGDAPLLSVAPNVLFDVARLNLGGGKGAINNFGTLQTTNQNQYIGLISGNVNMNGGQINAPSGRVELGGLSVAGAVGLSTDGNNLRAQFPTNLGRADVALTNQSIVDVAGAGGGDIAITARNISLLTGSFIRGGIETGVGTPEAVAGDIKINATGEVSVIGSSSGILNAVNSKATGQGGNITIDASSILLDGAAMGTLTTGQGNAGNINIKTTGDLTINGNNDIAGISSSTGGQGNAGKITIDAQGNISLANSGAIFAAIAPGANGDSQGISITAKNLNLSNKSFISSNSFGDKGNAGDVKIKVSGAVDVVSGGIASGVGTGTKGNGGNVAIDVGSISLKDGAKLTASTSGTGNAGNVTVIAKDAISLVNGDILSTVESGGVGKGGKIDVNAGSLSIKDSAQLSTSTFRASDTQPAGRGDAGNISIKTTGDLTVDGNNKATGISTSTYSQGSAGKITIDAQGNISLANSGAIFAAIAPGANGNSQGISITAKNLNLSNDSFISSSSFSDKGNAGDITIKASGAIDVVSSAIASPVGTGTFGNSGNITLIADSISLRDGISLVTSTLGQGSAGNILLNSGKILLNKGDIFSTSFSTSGGNITIKNTDYLLLRNNSSITTNSDSTAKNGNGGNITITSPVIAATSGSNDITANANQGTGGQVSITSQGLFGIQYRPKGQASDFTNDITASSTFGRDGAVNISTPGTDPGKDNTELPKVPTDASNQISQVCGANTRENKLTVTGRGGLPPNANDPLTSDVVWQDTRAASPQPVATNPKANPAKLAAPAVGWVFDGKGKVILVAAGTQGQPTGTSVVCPQTK